MNGPTNFLVATKEIYSDLSRNIFNESCKKNLKKDHFALINLATVVCINLSHFKNNYS
jgi:hypothetical protein